MYNYGLIGNCQVSALVSETASIDWLCLPKPDSEPVFGRLLDSQGGFFSISPASPASNLKINQKYLENTNILITHFMGAGEEFRIIDFCPRFEQYGRMYRPLSVFRIVEPIKGSPFIKVECKPISGWSKEQAKMVRGNSHLHFEVRQEALRLTTTMPLTYLIETKAFRLQEKTFFCLSWGAGLEEELASTAERFLQRTEEYWKKWVKHCSIPSLFQKETIRSALALKLHCYEDTGAIFASVTTSLPEQVGHERNWDYRFCWLRDAYFVLSAFRSLGHFEEMEGFLKFVLQLVYQPENPLEYLRPVYCLNQEAPLPEVNRFHWEGYHHSKPVRTGNQAAEHIQNDVYGEIILTLAPIFFDERLHGLRTIDLERLMVELGGFCEKTLGKADAGLWEIRGGWQEHSFTNLMCWAGLEKLESIGRLGYLAFSNKDYSKLKAIAEERLRQAILDGVLLNGPSDPSEDASLSLLSILRFPDKELNKKTLYRIIDRLSMQGSGQEPAFFYRYLRPDDFGRPESAFLICSFWIAQALAVEKEHERALTLMKDIRLAANHLGLFSEHFEVSNRKQLGNFPQAYSHVGMINAAFAVSPPWSEIV